jgi:hypothetical protein
MRYPVTRALDATCSSGLREICGGCVAGESMMRIQTT